MIYTRSAADGGVDYFGIIADVNIGSIFVNEAANDGDDVGYDNFRLGTPGEAAAPEPASLLLFGLGALGLVWSRRRKY